MNLSGILVLLALASLVGRIVKAVQKGQQSGGGRNPPPSPPQATPAHEAMPPTPRAWRGVEAFREIMAKLEEAASEAPRQPGKPVDFAQAFPEPEPSFQGEVTVSTQGVGFGEGKSPSQEPRAAKPEGSAPPTRAAPSVRQSARGYLAGAGGLRRAVVLSEVLGKPLSLRRGRTVL